MTGSYPRIPEFQTRSEVTGLAYFDTFKEALEAHEKDKTIWKISFGLPNGERIRLIHVQGLWYYDPIGLDEIRE